MNEKYRNTQFKTGDIGFVSGTSIGSKIINFFTFGDKFLFRASHVYLHYDEDQIYEQETHFDGKGQATITSYDKYIGKHLQVFRPNFLTDDMRFQMQLIMDERIGTPYSYWDCFLNGIFFFLHPQIKGDLIAMLGSTKFTKCDEEAMFVTYLVSNYKPFSKFSSLNPQELLMFIWNNKDFNKIYDSEN